MIHARSRAAGRWTGAVILLVVGVLAVTVSIFAVFVRDQLLDTDSYVKTVSPLAENPAVQTAIAHRLTDEITKKADLQGRINDALQSIDRDRLADRLSILSGPVADALGKWLYGRVLEIVKSRQFATAWDAANRAAHEQLKQVLTGSDSGVVRSSGTTVSIDVGAFVGVLTKQLQERGFGLAGKIPKFSLQYTILQSDQLPRIRSAVSTLDKLATWLPLLGMLLIVFGVFVAPSRRRGLLITGLLVALFGVVVLIALNYGRHRYLAELPASVGSPGAAAAIFDTLLRTVLAAGRLELVLGIGLAVGAWLFGPARAATWVRQRVGSGLDFLADRLHRTGVQLDWARWIPAWRPWLIGGVGALFLLVWLIWDPLRLATLAWLGGFTLVLWGVVEVLSRAVTARGSSGSEPVTVTHGDAAKQEK